METQRSWNCQNAFEKEEQSRRLVKANFKAYKVMLIRSVWYGRNGGDACRCNRVESGDGLARVRDS